jgi:thiol-disulfide isomerase/thioredoxin
MPPAGMAGRVTLVHFFATWCAPCKEELASLETLAGTLAGRPFVVLAVDVGEPPVRVRRFFTQNPVRFPVLLDEERKAMKAWRVETFPTSFLIGPDGKTGFKLEGDTVWTAPEVLRRIEGMLPATPPKGR